MGLALKRLRKEKENKWTQQKIKQVGFNSPCIFLICLGMLPCKFVSHKELQHEFNHTVLLCCDEVLHCIIGLLVCVAKWKIQCWNAFSDTSETVKPQNFSPNPPAVLSLASWANHPLAQICLISTLMLLPIWIAS